MPDMKEGADAAMIFQDWVEVSYSVMSDISENSSVWWSGVLQQVEQTYAVWLAAAPLEKLSIEPKSTDVWSGGKWTRVNARGSSMLLAAMPAELRGEMVSRRYTQDCIKMLFKAYTAYQPGGSAERHDVLRRLQSPGDYMTSDNLDGALKVIRSWPRWLERCKAVQMSPPDPSVLARGLMALTTKYIDSSADASFRTSMLRTTLRLDARPTLEQVQAYQKHLQAELEVIALSAVSTGNAQPKLRAVDQALQAKARDASKPTTGGGELCRYFARASGCKRGEKCGFSHSMAGLDKETRAKKCLRCGSEAHRQRDCTVGRTTSKSTSTTKAQGDKGGGSSTPSSNQSTMATLGTTVSSTSTTEVPTVAGTPWTLEALIQAAQQVVQPTPGTISEDTSPEKTRPAMKTLHLKDIRICSVDSSMTALVDSGATHSLRSAISKEEWQQASEVTVVLAGNHRLIMRISEAGTLLMPFRGDRAEGESLQAQTIVPMGQLIKTLGYTMVWGPATCYLESPEGHRMQLQVDNGCPQLCELEALSLIARLEDRRLEELNNSVLTTKDRLKMSAVAMARTWDYYLLDYVTTGSFESGLRAVRDAPFLSDLPGECLRELIPTAGLWSGWDALKNIGFLSRPQRRKLWGSGRWVVHLFSGGQGHWQLFKLDSGDTTVLELDSARCAGQDIMRLELWQMLMWGAKEGKIDLVMGGPPGRSAQHGRGGVRDVKSMTLVARMLWLHAVAQVGREVNGGASTRNRDVGFMLEYPEGRSQEVRGARAAKIEADEDATRSATGQGSPATWNETRWLWEHVQQPRLEMQIGAATMDARVPFWDTRLWKEFQRMNGLRLVSFDQGAMGGTSVNPTTLGTNVNNLLSLNELRVPQDSELPLRGDRDHIWAPGLVEALVVGFSFWDRDPRCAPRLPHLQAFTPEQWKDHVNSNHAVYRKDCAVCVSSRGTGKQHRRVHHPDSYVLTADMAGPLSPGLDPTSKGTMGRNLRYILVAKYSVPKQYLTMYTGKEPPSDGGVDLDLKDKASEEQEKLLEDFFGKDNLEGDGDSDLKGMEVKFIPEDPLVIPPEDYAEPNEEEPEPSEEEAEKGKLDRDPVGEEMPHVDCEVPEMTFLTFGVALPNNQSSTVKKGLQDIVLYLQAHGLPVYRFHADKGEFYNHMLRTWLRDQGIYATWAEPSIPQTNGSAESIVRWVKDRARTLLRASSLPTRLWPVAVATATAEQRSRVLSWKTALAAPFGAPVYLKKKGFDKAGPLRREQGLEPKWQRGRYVGLSSILHHGHLVYVPGTEGEREKFFHTLHVRPNLVEPGGPDVELRADITAKPRRRVLEKTPVEEIEMKRVTATSEEMHNLAVTKAKEILDSWSLMDAMSLVTILAEDGFFESRKFGVDRHGGSVGWLKGLPDYPDLSRLLAKIVTDHEPEATFTSVLVSCNVGKDLHRDINNDYQTKNYVIPIECPSDGGSLWIELKEGDVVQGQVECREQGEKRLYGQMRPLIQGKSIVFGPRRYHEVSPWVGNRIVIIAYTPDCLGKLSHDDLQQLHIHDFPVPLSQLPEFTGSCKVEGWNPYAYSMKVDELPGRHLEEVRDEEWTMYLDLEPGMVEITSSTKQRNQTPALSKVDVGFTKDIEKVLAELTGPLEVTHNVSPSDVVANLEVWRPAIEKEVKGIQVGVQRLLPGSEERREWVNKARAQRLPTKFVFTVKPNDQADPDKPETWCKRKARLVICGNLAADEGNPLYTEAAPAEAVRTSLAIAMRNGWWISVLDVVAAFLRTPLGRRETDPVIIAQPPKLLEALNITVAMELWGLVRALYGLREAPQLWGSYRDDTLKAVELPRGLKWKQGKAVTSWWSVRDEQGVLQGIIVVYVDDFLICAPKVLAYEIAEVVQEKWETSQLMFLEGGTTIRFLGMELKVCEGNPGKVELNQHGYIMELLRSHGISSKQQDKVPITKELAAIPDVEEELSEAKVRCAQQITGEVLWLAQRTRPDLAYTTSLMAAMCTKYPTRVAEIGVKTLGYLQRTIDVNLEIEWSGSPLTMYCDASYAPQSARSHGGWVVLYGGIPLLWRSGRQQMVTLSTAESELLAILDGAIASKGVEAILGDLGEVIEEKVIKSDSTAALSISSGSSSWRTRHLKIKANWLHEQLDYGSFKAVHCPGERQLADMLTKALSSARLNSLLSLWGVRDRRQPPASTLSTTQVSAKAMVALICCLLMVSVQAREGEDSGPGRGTGVQVDWDMAGVLMVLLMALGALLLWETLKWVQVIFQAFQYLRGIQYKLLEVWTFLEAIIIPINLYQILLKRRMVIQDQLLEAGVQDSYGHGGI
eukprot:s910_g5.t1